MRQQRIGCRIALLQITVREIGVDGSVADRMDRFARFAAPAFGNRMVPFGYTAHLPPAQPTVERGRRGRLLLIEPVA